jgi:hypothetical protein
MESCAANAEADRLIGELEQNSAMWRTKEGEPVTWGASAAARTGGACRSQSG